MTADALTAFYREPLAFVGSDVDGAIIAVIETEIYPDRYYAGPVAPTPHGWQPAEFSSRYHHATEEEAVKAAEMLVNV
jgi:hypothetical protein